MPHRRLGHESVPLNENQCTLRFTRNPANIKVVTTTVTVLEVDASNPHPISEAEGGRCRIPTEADLVVFPHWSKSRPTITK